MQLDQIQANIRLRRPWEAIDLGFAMVQHWWRQIFLAWFLFFSLIASVLWFVMPIEYLWLVFIPIWWLKPIYDRFLLHILSHQLFNDQQTTAEIFKQIPTMLKKNGLISGLTYRRFSFSRGFNLPIWQLEKLTGKRRKNRQQILHLDGHTQAVWLTIIGFILELIIEISLIVLIFLFLPENLQQNFWDFFLFSDEESDYIYSIELTQYIFYLLAIFIIEPLYVAGSFSLYLNRRTQLDGWDIALVFKNLASRLK